MNNDLKRYDENGILKEDLSDGYYHVLKDIEDYPDAWCIVAYSKRGTGKTYSALWTGYWKHIKIAYMKRTNDDVKLICKYDSKNKFDLSPYVAVNRDKGTNVHPRLIDKGIGGFYIGENEDDVKGAPIGLIFSLNAIKSIKGIEASDCDWMILDEFIPQQGEVVKHAEGDMLLDLYMTLSRDREDRGKPPLKLILFANAEDIVCPIASTLEIVDDLAELTASGKTHKFLEDRGILLHHVIEYKTSENQKRGIYKAMKDTAWGRKSFEGDFANNDFSNVVKRSVKRMSPFIHLHYKNYDWYVYIDKNGAYYMSKTKQRCPYEYDLNTENHQKGFYIDFGIDLRNGCIDGNMKFETYSMYDIIVNYKKRFEL